MSVLPLKTYASEGVPIFGSASGTTVISSFADLTCSTITVNDGYVGLGGGHELSTINGQLYYDNELLACQSSISSLTKWSYFPAISTVNFVGENLQNVGAFNASTIRQAGTTGASQTLTTTTAGATFSQAVSTATGTTLSTSVETAALKFQSAGNPVGTIALDSTIKGAYILDSANNTYTFSGGVFASDQVSTQKATVSSLVVNDIQAVTLTVQSTIHAISTISSAVILAESANFSTLWGQPSSFYQPYVPPDSQTFSSLTTSTIAANTGFFSSLTAQEATISSLAVSSLKAGFLDASGATFSTLWGQPSSFYQPYVPPATQTFSSISVSSILGIPDVNVAAEDITLVADEGTNPNIAAVSVTAKGGVGGNITLTADTGAGGTSFGAINLVANGGTTGGIGTGGSITIQANTPTGTLSNASSKVSIDAAGVNVYAGAVAPIASLTGYLFNYGTLGINQCVGLPSVIPNFPGTLYQYATGGLGYGGIRFESPAGVECVNSTDFYAYRIYPYFNPFAIGTLPDLTIAGRSHAVQNTQFLSLSTVRNLDFGDDAQIGVIRGLSSINGFPISYYQPQPTVSSFADLYTSSLVASTVVANDTVQVPALIQISSINGFPISYFEPSAVSTVSSFSELYTSSLFASTLTASNLDVLAITSLSSINGKPITDLGTSTFQTLYVENIRPSTTSVKIDTPANPGFGLEIASGLTELTGANVLIQTSTNSGGLYISDGQSTLLYSQLDLQLSALSSSKVRISGDSTIVSGPLFTSSFYTSSINGAAYPPPSQQIPMDLTVSTLTSGGATSGLNAAFQNVLTAGQQLVVQSIDDNIMGVRLFNGSNIPLELDMGLATPYSGPTRNQFTFQGPVEIQPGIQGVYDFSDTKLTIYNAGLQAPQLLGISSINGQPYAPPTTVSSFIDLNTSTLTVSTLAGTPDLSIVGGVIDGTVSSFSIEAQITQSAIRVFPTLTRITNNNEVSLYGRSTIENISNSTITLEAPKIVMDQSPLFVSSLTVSSINGLPPGGSGGIQSLIGGNQINITNQSTINLNTNVAVSSLTASYFEPSTISTIIFPSYSNVFVPGNSSTILWPGSGPYAFRQTINAGTAVYRARTALSSFVYTLASNDYAPFTFDPAIPGNFAWFEIQLPGGGGWGPYMILGVANIGGQYYINNTPYPAAVSNLYFGSGTPTTSTITIPGSSNFTYITPSSITTSTLYISSINNAAYPPPLPTVSTVSTFQNLYTETLQPNPLNPDSIIISTPTSQIILANTKINASASEITLSTGTTQFRTQSNLAYVAGPDIYINAQNNLNLDAPSTISKGRVFMSSLTVSSINGSVFPQPPQPVPANLAVSTLTVNGIYPYSGNQAFFTNQLQGNPALTDGLYINPTDTNIFQIGYKYYGSNIASMDFGLPGGQQQIRFNSLVEFADKVNAPALINVSSINNAVYPPPQLSGSTFSTLYLTPSTIIKGGSGFPELQSLNSSNFSTGQVLASSYRLGGFVGDPNTGSYTRDVANRATYVDSNLAVNRLLYTIDSNATISTISSVSISTNTMTTSSIQFQTGLFSTLLFSSTPTTIGIASSMLYVDRQSDFSVGNNNILAGQMRIGFNQPAGTAGANRRAELIFYNQGKTEYNFSVQNLDRTIRTATTFSTLTAADEGYMLDTRVNPIFCSSINYSPNLMAWFPSSINSTIGVSTMTVIPNYIWSGFHSTSQAITSNVINPLFFNAQTANIGGFLQTGSTITVPVSGVYSLDCSIQFITASGGRNDAYWLLQKNGVPVPWTSSRLTVNNDTDNVGTTIFTDFANAGDKYSFCVYSQDQNMLAGAQNPFGPLPGIPSVIANIRRLG